MRNPPPKPSLSRPDPPEGVDGLTALTPAPLPQAPLDDAQRLACLRLIRSENVGPVTFRELINHFGGAAAALEALPELARRGGQRRAPRLCPRDRAEAELAAAAKAKARPVFTIEPGYPPLLAHVAAPPPMIYARGDLDLLARPALAIVGSRNASAAGIKLTRHFATALGEAGFVIVSGMARGIDAAAHEAALARGTIAVLAGGIDVIYPPEHADLYQRISESGCVVSEMPPGYVARAQEFPRRNRVISGVSHGVVVIEAARRSGTLTTARHAAEQGRDVFAVPGHPLDPRAEGTNHLLKEGASLVTEPDDVLKLLRPLLEPSRQMAEAATSLAPLRGAAVPAPIDDADRQRVLVALGPAPIDIDEVVRATGLAARNVRIALIELALAGRVVQHGAQLVSLAPDAGPGAGPDQADFTGDYAGR